MKICEWLYNLHDENLVGGSKKNWFSIYLKYKLHFHYTFFTIVKYCY